MVVIVTSSDLEKSISKWSNRLCVSEASPEPTLS